MITCLLKEKLVFKAEWKRTRSTENFKENSECAPAFVLVLDFLKNAFYFAFQIYMYQGNAKGMPRERQRNANGTLQERVRVDFSVRLLLSSTVGCWVIDVKSFQSKHYAKQSYLNSQHSCFHFNKVTRVLVRPDINNIFKLTTFSFPGDVWGVALFLSLPGGRPGPGLPCFDFFRAGVPPDLDCREKHTESTQWKPLRSCVFWFQLPFQKMVEIFSHLTFDLKSQLRL